MRLAIATNVIPGDLASIVDALCNRACWRRQWMVEGGIGAPSPERVRGKEEAVLSSSGVFEIEPDDLARVVDAGCNRA